MDIKAPPLEREFTTARIQFSRQDRAWIDLSLENRSRVGGA
jgi:hypothetical protein